MCNIDYTSKDGCAQTKLTPERINEQIVDVRVVTLVPNEHAQTVEFPQQQFINKVVDDRVTTQSHSPSEDEKKQSRSLRFDSEPKWWIPVVQQTTDNREQMRKSSFRKFRRRSRFRSHSLHMKR